MDDAYHLCDLLVTSFLAHMSTVHPQPLISWQIYSLTPELLSCMISILRRKLCEQDLLSMQYSRGCTISGWTSAPPCWSIVLSKIHPSLISETSKSMGTGSDTLITLSNAWTDMGKSRFLRYGG